MLPAPAVFHFLWEVNSGAVKEGDSVRTFGRCSMPFHLLRSGHYYEPFFRQQPPLIDELPTRESKATLSIQHAARQHQVVVQTTFVEPFDPIIGAQYIVLGEIEKAEGGDGVMVHAHVLNCVDGVNLALLQRGVN